MGKKDLFDEPYDDGTLVKLTIFEDYFKEWLPVFLVAEQPLWKEIQVFDLFGGEGKDINGVYGSPMRILEILNKNAALIIKSGVKIRVIINEFDKKKYELLTVNLKSIANESLYALEHYNNDFHTIFSNYYESMKSTANFLFLDQNGIKQITEKVFKQLMNLKQTDFLFFISSSYINRFGEVEEFKKYLNITKQDLAGKSYYHIHRIVLDYYRSLIPIAKQYFLAPFSIKKTAGIYGLIFGSNHIYGLEKFLTVSWKHDKLTGEANFDIDNEKIDVKKPSLFEEFNIPQKIQLFELSLRINILRKAITTDLEAYIFGLEDGFLMKHVNKVLNEMRDEKIIDFDFRLINSRAHKISKPSIIKILNNGTVVN